MIAGMETKITDWPEFRWISRTIFDRIDTASSFAGRRESFQTYHIGVSTPRGQRAVIVRSALVNDRDVILRVHADAIRRGASTRYSPQEIEAWVAFPAPEGHEAELRSGHVFVAEEGGQIVGYGRFDTDSGEVEATYVLPEAQGRGVGRALLAEAEARARRAGFDVICVSASLNAIAFYQRAGFEPQVRRFYDLPGGLHLECMFMLKRLHAPSSGMRAGRRHAPAA